MDIEEGDWEEEEGGSMEDEGEGEETMVGEMVAESILGLEGKMTVVVGLNGVVEVTGMIQIHQVTSPGVAVEAPSHTVKINFPLGMVQGAVNHLQVNKMILGQARWLVLKGKNNIMTLGQARWLLVVLRILVVAGTSRQKTLCTAMGEKKERMMIGQTRLILIKVKNKKLIPGPTRCLLLWVLKTKLIAGTCRQRALHLRKRQMIPGIVKGLMITARKPIAGVLDPGVIIRNLLGANQNFL